ncbi:hypothetical protein J8J04_01320 ['Fragaria x ananassa' phyllody phytoplasma]|uniref:Transmembrane protein n=1 Tax='Fragaria x ananassa' phyllody phytoplasma TaxID=2358428 RepID=A0ABS5K392_9MOLU|nr:hypothetical protein ['Fragaria x ananassa' phyllody phytoplasma]MBS2126342.1 hypothetical protein ['Fragaria x ananassa' phyllody phytoplasma]
MKIKPQIKQKIKKIIFICNYFKNTNIVFFFLMLAIFVMIFSFIVDYQNACENNKSYWYNKYQCPTYKEGGVLDYSRGWYPNHNTLIKMIFYFTYQSNLFVLLVYILFFTKFRYQKWYHYLVFACLISILMTGLIFHIVINQFQHLTTFKLKLSYFLSHLQHTLIPLIFVYFYFKVNIFAISYYKIWIAWVHPFLYMLFFSLFGYCAIKPYLNKFKKDQPIVTSQQDAKIDPFKHFPYWFFSPFYPDQKFENQKKDEAGKLKKNDVSQRKKQYRFCYGGYERVLVIFIVLFVPIFIMTFILLYMKRRMSGTKYHFKLQKSS